MYLEKMFENILEILNRILLKNKINSSIDLFKNLLDYFMKNE